MDCGCEVMTRVLRVKGNKQKNVSSLENLFIFNIAVIFSNWKLK